MPAMVRAVRIMPQRLDSKAADFAARFRAFLDVKREASVDVEQAVRTIIDDVRSRGDHALIDLSKKFDRVELDKLGLRISADEISDAAKSCDRAGLDVPGGTAAYPSSVLMNAVPAKVAGVPRLVMVVPAPDGKLSPLVLAAAQLAGVDEVYRVGGAQAVAALAFGTE